MNTLLPYTFTTNPFKHQLINAFSPLFKFRKLTEDFPKLALEILKGKPEHILGIAWHKYKVPRFETTAINQFNKTKYVSKTGPREFKLFVPNLDNTPFKKNPRSSDTFCNWTMYKIAQFIEQEQLNTKLMFVHLREEDLDGLVDLMKSLY